MGKTVSIRKDVAIGLYDALKNPPEGIDAKKFRGAAIAIRKAIKDFIELRAKLELSKQKKLDPYSAKVKKINPEFISLKNKKDKTPEENIKFDEVQGQLEKIEADYQLEILEETDKLQKEIYKTVEKNIEINFDYEDYLELYKACIESSDKIFGERKELMMSVLELLYDNEKIDDKPKETK
jgi:hypothetical protein